MAATIRDVARRAGVSVATVSRVLNSSGPVRDSTRERVEEAIVALEYTPHGGARGLIMRRTTNLGVILPDLYGEFFSQVIRGMDQVARRSGYHLLVSSSHANRDEVEAALGAMRGRVDGLILMSPDIIMDDLTRALSAGLPVVLVNSAVQSNGRFDTVNVDNRGGAYAVVRHLAGMGHERIGFIGGPANNHDARERAEAYRRALADGGLERREEWEVTEDFTKSGGYRAARRLVGLGDLPTAVFAANDSMAVGAMSAFQESGLRVPEDVAVAGFDDLPVARYVTPALTTVHVDLLRLGERTMELLLLALKEDGGREARHEQVATTLAIRRSCGAPVPGSGMDSVREAEAHHFTQS